MKKLLVVMAAMIVVFNLTAFAGGDGSESDPYWVTNPTELDDVRNNMTSHFIQMADIDLDVAPYNSGEGWLQIGSQETGSFRGVYDGNGYIISNLYINRPDAIRVGLFGLSNYAVMKNITIENANVTGSSMVGPLIGHFYRSTIEKCATSGEVHGSYAGGMFGWNYQGTALNSYSRTDVYGTVRIFGFGDSSNSDDYPLVNCYSTGSINTVDTGYGFSEVHTSIQNCFWDIETSGYDTGSGGTGKTTEDMKTESTFTNAGWDFTDNWAIDPGINDGYPYLLITPWGPAGSDFPAGDNTDVGGSTTINPSVDLNYAADQTIPPIPNPSFVAGYEVVLSGTGIVDITINTGYMYGSIYQNGEWSTVESSGGIIFFSDVDFDAKGDVPLVLGDDNPLPVVLSTFTAIQTLSGYAQLNWTTQSESNILGYNIYRNTNQSSENAQKMNLSLIAAHNTSYEQNYSFIDESVEWNKNYFFWVESVEYSGDSDYFGPVRIVLENNEEPEAPEILHEDGIKSIYPNPFNPNTTISYYLEDVTDVLIEIYNTTGQMIYLHEENRVKGLRTFTWNGTNAGGKSVSSGIYFITLKTTSIKEIRKAVLMK